MLRNVVRVTTSWMVTAPKDARINWKTHHVDTPATNSLAVEAAVKLGRREARAAKKGLKTTFKQEQAEMSKKRPTGDVRQGLSVRVID